MAKAKQGALSAAWGARERLNTFLVPLTWWAGWVGVALLLGCAVLYWLPFEKWPPELKPGRWGFYAGGSLVLASFLGWSCLQEGMSVLRKPFGELIGELLFAALPLSCALLSFALGRGWLLPTSLPAQPWSGLVIAWFPASLLALSCVTFVLGRARLREEGGTARVFLWALVLVPYGLLTLALGFGLESPLLDGHLRSTLKELGWGTLGMQVGVAYFLCGGSR